MVGYPINFQSLNHYFTTNPSLHSWRAAMNRFIIEFEDHFETPCEW